MVSNKIRETFYYLYLKRKKFLTSQGCLYFLDTK
jgi:hypothetical protein